MPDPIAELFDRIADGYLDSLHDHHPAHGKRLIAGAIFERLVRR